MTDATTTTDDRLADVPEFEAGGVMLRCWVVDQGRAYAWRSACGRIEVTRVLSRMEPIIGVDGAIVGKRDASEFGSTVDGKPVRGRHPSLRAAMVAAAAEMASIDRKRRAA